MSYNASPKGCDMHQNIQPCILSSKKVNEESPLKSEPNNEQKKQGDVK